MRIALVSLDYPPDSTEGVARQRQVLATALARLGHDVHVITLGTRTESREQDGVWIHRYDRNQAVNEYLPALPVLDRPLTDAQLLCEAVHELAERLPVDVVDVPLWLAQPLALVRQPPCPVVIWLQTTLLHLVELQQRAPRVHEQALVEIDRYCLSQAAACIADSRSVLDDVIRLYDLPALRRRSSQVYPGLPDAAPRTEVGPRAGGFNALVVGRLEQRKGTMLLFDALPQILSNVPELQVTFVGRDNSDSDGFRQETGVTYPQAFRDKCPELASRVSFEGYVDEVALMSHYAAADLLIHPAHYESFGLIFLEAMRASLPTAAFCTGGAAEVFAHGESDGALLCQPGDVEGFGRAVTDLVRNHDRRDTLGQAARKRFEAKFSDDRMARETAAVYARVVADDAHRPPRPSRRPRLFQVMEALQPRDAVSRIARTNAPILEELGGERPIMALFAESRVRAETGRLRSVRFRSNDAAIFHYWGFSRLERLIADFPGPKAIHYHNITPPRFFPPRSLHFEMTTRGYAQLDRIADLFDLVVGDSRYNLDEFARHLSAPKPMLCVYPVVDTQELLSADWDRDCAERTAADGQDAVWLFVGRFAPNKRQDQVMRAFDHFAASTGRGRLIMVGDTLAAPAFVARLDRLRNQLGSAARISIVPSVSAKVLRGYYRAADLFVCASEHEGFCLPLAEAMVFGVPTIALDRGAVSETLGRSGVLVQTWDPGHVSELAASLLGTPEHHAGLVAAQRERLQSFSPVAVRRQLRAVVDWLSHARDRSTGHRDTRDTLQEQEEVTAA